MRGVCLFACLVVALGYATVNAQWLNYPTPGVPRTDGKPDLSAPTPRTPDAKPDLSGLWRAPREPRYYLDIASDLPAGSVPFQPWAQKVYDERAANFQRDDPTAKCIPGGVPRVDLVPYPFRIITAPGRVVFLYEAVHSWREVFTDGRELPVDPNATWMGYLVGRWDKDVFVIETIGFNDQGWIDNNGKPSTKHLHVTERFHRKSFGQMDLMITIDDSGAYTRPWTVTVPLGFQADNDLLEYVCNENNKYFDIIPKAQGAALTDPPSR